MLQRLFVKSPVVNIARVLERQQVAPSRISIEKYFSSSVLHKMSCRPKVLVTRGDIPEAALACLREKCDLDIASQCGPLSREDLLNKIAGKNAILCMLTDKIDKPVLDIAGPDLKVVSTMSVGYDHLDVNEIKSRGISIGYTPGVLTGASAELTVALVLATTRRLFEAHEELISGGWGSWSPLWMCGSGVIGAKVGIVGLGNIGLAVAKRLIPFEISDILYTGRTPKPEHAEQVSAQFVSLEQLLRESDIVVVTCSLNESTKNLFGPAQFALMKPSAIFVNTSRGGVVDQDALIHALKTGQIAAAGLDVMTPEPLPLDHELIKLKNCVLLPHIASATVKTRISMATMAAMNIVNGLEGKPMPAKLC